ncbi:hypothetical protein GCM10010299_40780 [Streptomyces tanashiensis]|nr:hypothetical protein GCM10010299_40780 [Streptomyces tanashiensis]
MLLVLPTVGLAEVLRLPVRLLLVPLLPVRLPLLSVRLPLLSVPLLRAALRRLLPLLLRVRRRGRVVPVRRLLRLLLRGAVVPAASVPESSHVVERTRFRCAGAPQAGPCH